MIFLSILRVGVSAVREILFCFTVYNCCQLCLRNLCLILIYAGLYYSCTSKRNVNHRGRYFTRTIEKKVDTLCTNISTMGSKDSRMKPRFLNNLKFSGIDIFSKYLDFGHYVIHAY